MAPPPRAPAGPGGAGPVAGLAAPGAAPAPPARGGVAPPPAPPAAAAPPPAPSLADQLRSRAVQELRIRSKIASRERDHLGGHILARHSPDLPDDILKRRLQRGIDHEGAVAVTSGVSSRFLSREVYASTLMAVIEHLHAGLLETLKYLRRNIPAANWPSMLVTGNTVPGPVPGATGDLRLAIEQTQTTPGMLPVYWSDARKRVQFFKKYQVMMRHRDRVGVGFYGTRPRQGNVQGQAVTLFDNVHPFQGPGEHTFSLLGPPDEADRAVGGGVPIADWRWVTHYPTDPQDDQGKPRSVDREVKGKGKD